MISFKNSADQTPLQVAQSFEIRNLLQWSLNQEGFYFLPSPPVVLMMYSTPHKEAAYSLKQKLEDGSLISGQGQD